MILITPYVESIKTSIGRIEFSVKGIYNYRRYVLEHIFDRERRGKEINFDNCYIEIGISTPSHKYIDCICIGSNHIKQVNTLVLG